MKRPEGVLDAERIVHIDTFAKRTYTYTYCQSMLRLAQLQGPFERVHAFPTCLACIALEFSL